MQRFLNPLSPNSPSSSFHQVKKPREDIEKGRKIWDKLQVYHITSKQNKPIFCLFFISDALELFTEPLLKPVMSEAKNIFSWKKKKSPR